MKKKIAVSILVILLMICAETVVFGDVVALEPFDYVYKFSFVLGFIGIIVLIISLMSFMILKVAIKKNKDNNLNKERKIKAKNKLQTIIYVSIIILTIVGIIGCYAWYRVIILAYDFIISAEIFCIVPLILIIISIIFRGKRNKKVSNIILRNINNNNLYYGINTFYIFYSN